MSVYLERFQGILENYREELAKARKGRKITGGLFGFGAGPGDDPCHEAMDRQVGELTAELAADEASPEDTAELVTAVLQAEKNETWTDAAKWSVLAVQRYTIPLIGRIGKEERQKIDAWYEKAYPKRIRVPIQKKIIQELTK